MDHHGGAVHRVQWRGYGERDKTLVVRYHLQKELVEGAVEGFCLIM
jgi:hypothetical protein